jgi:hypothetical protein
MKIRLVAAAMLTLLSSAPAVFGQTTWTVAPSGPADFPSVAAALPVVAAGDVLLIAPGDYGSVTITKSLTLLGSQSASARPRFTVLRVEGATWIELYHLEANFLRLFEIPGRSRVEDLLVKAGTELRNTGELFVRGSDLRGADGSLNSPGGTGLAVVSTTQGGSRVQIVDSSIRGGNTSGDILGLPTPPGPGILLSLNASSQLSLVSTDVLGGSRLVASAFATAGPAVAVGFSGGRFEARGSSVHGLRGGATGPGQPLGGAAAFVDAAGIIQVEIGSNLEILGAVAPSVQFVPPRPYVQWTGTGGPGSNRSLECFGPAGDIAVAFAALGSLYDTTTIQSFGQPLTLDLNTLIWTASGTLLGQNLPLAFPVTLPPSPAFAGLALPTQAAVVSASDFSVKLTNGDDLLLSY